MSTIAEAKQAIYNRLASSPTFHPASADLFADWTLQSGDIVTVNSGEESYSVPVFGLNMRWNGSPKVTVQSSGSQTRPSLEQMAVQKFSGSASGGAMANGSSYRSYRSQVKTSQQLYWEMTDDNGILKSSISATETELRTEYQNADTGLGSRIDQNAKSISMSVGRVAYDSSKKRNVSQLPDISTADPSLFYYVTGTKKYYIVSDGEWKQVDVDVATNGAYYIKAGEIAIAINDSGQTEAHIDAKKVILGQTQLTADDLETWAKDGNTHGGVFAKFLTVSSLTAQEIETVLANIGDAHIGGLYVDNSEQGADDAFIAGGLNIDHITFENQTEPLRLPGSDGYDDYAPHTVTINGTVQATKILSTGDLSFSRATSLTPAWSGGATAGATATLTLTGSPDTSLTYEVVIGSGAYSATKTTLEVTSGGVAAIDESVAKSVSVPVKINQLNGSGTQPTQVYTKDITYSIASLLESKTGNNKVTANGSVSLSPGKLGFSAVTVAVPMRVSFDSSYTPEGASEPIKVVKGNENSQFEYLRIWQRVNSLTGSGASAHRTVETFAGSSQVEIAEITDYGDGYTAGLNATGAERDSRISGYAQDSGTTSNVLTAYDTVYKLTSQYIDSSGNWTDGGEYLVKTPASGGPSRNAKIEPSDFERIASGSGIADSQKQLDIRGDQWYKITPKYINATTGEYDSTTTAANIVYFKTPSVTILQALNPPSNWTNKGTLTRGRKVYVQYKHADGQTKNHPEYWEVPGNPSDYVSGLTKESQKVKTGVQRARSGVEFTAYYWDGNSSSYVSMGSHYWWYTDTSGYSSDDYDFYWKNKA